MNTQALLFDLDGTLIDTAPDLVCALNTLLTENDREALSYDRVRPHVPNGALGILACGFPDVTDEQNIEALRQRYFDIYASMCTNKAEIFDGLEEQITLWENSGKPWGIVTNKPTRFTLPLLKHLSLDSRIAVLVCGDTLSKRKPDPMPLLHAADELNIAAENCVYVGDDKRDVIACKAANMPCLAATYDFIPENEKPEQWGANALLDSPLTLLDTITQLNT